jgi:hypothetical protein
LKIEGCYLGKKEKKKKHIYMSSFEKSLAWQTGAGMPGNSQLEVGHISIH